MHAYCFLSIIVLQFWLFNPLLLARAEPQAVISTVWRKEPKISEDLRM